MLAQNFAYLFSLAIEIPIAVLLLGRDRRSRLIAGATSLVATSVTHPILWWIEPGLRTLLSYWPSIVLLELAVFVVESFFYRVLARATWRRALLTSGVANAASWLLGLLCWYLVWP